MDFSLNGNLIKHYVKDICCYKKEVPYTWTSLLHLSFYWKDGVMLTFISKCHTTFTSLKNKPTMFIKFLTTFNYIVGNKYSQNILSYAFAKSSFNKIISSLDHLA
jgi:hypothetical protein